MKIKIIDLLVKMANGEELPKKITYDGATLKYDEVSEDYSGYYGRSLFENKTALLNDEVEIIEEPKENK